MKILVGWSEEVSHNKWDKGDVELDTEDLENLLRDSDIPEARWSDLTTDQIYDLMSAEAERLACKLFVLHLSTVAHSSDKYDSSTLASRYQKLSQRKTQAIDKIKSALEQG